MQLNIPDEIVQNELANNITFIVLKEIENRLNLLTKTIELPPYPNKSQVRKILEIGDEKLNNWISKGLKFNNGVIRIFGLNDLNYKDF